MHAFNNYCHIPIRYCDKTNFSKILPLLFQDRKVFGKCLSLSDLETFFLYCIISRWCSQNDGKSWHILSHSTTLFDMLYIYFGHLVWRAIGKDPNAGQDWGQERRRGDNGGDGWMVSSTQATRVWANSGRQWKTGKPWCAAVHGAANSRTRLKDWTVCIKAFNPLITTLWNELLNIIPVYRWGNWSKD